MQYPSFGFMPVIVLTDEYVDTGPNDAYTMYETTVLTAQSTYYAVDSLAASRDVSSIQVIGLGQPRDQDYNIIAGPHLMFVIDIYTVPVGCPKVSIIQMQYTASQVLILQSIAIDITNRAKKFANFVYTSSSSSLISSNDNHIYSFKVPIAVACVSSSTTNLKWDGTLYPIPTTESTNQIISSFTYEKNEFGRMCIQNVGGSLGDGLKCSFVYMIPAGWSTSLNIYMINTNQIYNPTAKDDGFMNLPATPSSSDFLISTNQFFTLQLIFGGSSLNSLNGDWQKLSFILKTGFTETKQSNSAFYSITTTTPSEQSFATPCVANDFTITKTSDLLAGHHYVQLSTGDTTNNKITIVKPFSITTTCKSYQFKYLISTKMGTFVQDSDLTSTNAASLVVGATPANIEIPVTAPNFYNFALKLSIQLSDGTELKSQLSDWQINVNVGVAYILPQCNDAAGSTPLIFCGTSDSKLILNQIYTYSNDKTICYKALAADSVSNIYFADASGSFQRVVCPTSCTSANIYSQVGNGVSVSYKKSQLPQTIDLASYLSNPGSMSFFKTIIPDVVFQKQNLDWQSAMDNAVSNGGRMLDVLEWQNIFARRAGHNVYDNNVSNYRAQAIYQSNQWIASRNYELTDPSKGGRTIVQIGLDSNLNLPTGVAQYPFYSTYQENYGFNIQSYTAYTLQGSCTIGLLKYKTECYSHCGSSSGSCSFCGTGKCCRLGHTPSGDCTQTEGINISYHVCVPSQTCSNSTQKIKISSDLKAEITDLFTAGTYQSGLVLSNKQCPAFPTPQRFGCSNAETSRITWGTSYESLETCNQACVSSSNCDYFTFQSNHCYIYDSTCTKNWSYSGSWLKYTPTTCNQCKVIKNNIFRTMPSNQLSYQNQLIIPINLEITTVDCSRDQTLSLASNDPLYFKLTSKNGTVNILSDQEFLNKFKLQDTSGTCPITGYELQLINGQVITNSNSELYNFLKLSTRFTNKLLFDTDFESLSSSESPLKEFLIVAKVLQTQTVAQKVQILLCEQKFLQLAENKPFNLTVNQTQTLSLAGLFVNTQQEACPIANFTLQLKIDQVGSFPTTEGLKLVSSNNSLVADPTFNKNETIYLMAQTELGLKIFKQVDIFVPYVHIEKEVEIYVVIEKEIVNETIIEEVKNKSKEEEAVFEVIKSFTNSGPQFLNPLPAEIVFDLDLRLDEYAYISPIANDKEGDKITMDFKGAEGFAFIVIRQRQDNSFLLVVEETLVEPSMLGSYPIQILLSDQYSKGPAISQTTLTLTDHVEDDYGDEAATEEQLKQDSKNIHKGSSFPGVDPAAVDAALRRAKANEGKVIPDPQIEIKTITSEGKLVLEFNQEMIFPAIIRQRFYDDIFTIWVQSAITGEYYKSSPLYRPPEIRRRALKGDFIVDTGEDQDKKKEDNENSIEEDLKFGYIITNHTSTIIQIEILFNDQKKVSYTRYGMDKLRIQINSLEKFRSALTFKTMEQQSFSNKDRFLKQAIRPVLYDKEQVTQIKTITDSGGSVFILASTSNFIIGLLIGHSMQALWGMIRTLQLIVLSNLVNCPFPPHAAVFFEGCILFANMDILDGEVIYRTNMKMKSTPAYDDNFKRFGIGDQNFIYQSGSYFIIQFGVLCYFLIRYIVNRVAVSYNWINVFRRMGMWAYEENYCREVTQGTLKLFLEGYFDLLLCGFLQFFVIYDARSNEKDYDEFFKGFNNRFCFGLTVFFAISLCIFPVFGIHKVYIGSRDKVLDSNEFQHKYNYLISDLDLKKFSTAMYHMFFICNRIIIALTLVFIRSLPQFQIKIMLVLSSISMIYMTAWKPLENKSEQRMECFNESTIVICFYFIMQFLNPALKTEARDLLGWLLMGCATFNVLVNLSSIFFSSIRDSWDEMIESLENRRVANQIREKIENRRLITNELPGMFEDLERELQIRDAADFCREWHKHRNWLIKNRIALKPFVEEKQYQELKVKRKLHELAKFQKMQSSLQLAKEKFIQEQMHKGVLKRVRKNPFFQQMLKRANSKARRNLTVINEAESSSTSSDSYENSNGIKKQKTWGTIRQVLVEKSKPAHLENIYNQAQVVKNYELNKKKTWFKVVPNINLTKSQSSEQIFDLCEQIKSEKMSMKLQGAIKQVEDLKGKDDDDLKIDLQFLMSEDSDTSDEQVIAEKVKSEIAKPRKSIRIESQKNEGIVTMINGDESNILQSMMQVFVVIDELKDYFMMQKAHKFGNILNKQDLTKAITKLYFDTYRQKFEGHKKLGYNTIDISSLLQSLRVDPQHYKDILVGKMFKFLTDKVHEEMKSINYFKFNSKKHKQNVHKLKNGKAEGGKLDVFMDSCQTIFQKTFNSLMMNKFECLENHVVTRFHTEKSIGIYRSNNMDRSLKNKFQLKSFRIKCKKCDNPYMNVGLYKVVLFKPAPILVFTIKGKSENEDIRDLIDLYNYVPTTGIDFDLIYDLFAVIYKNNKTYECNVKKGQQWYKFQKDQHETIDSDEVTEVRGKIELAFYKIRTIEEPVQNDIRQTTEQSDDSHKAESSD